MTWKPQYTQSAAALLVVILVVILVQRGLWKGGVFHEGRSNDFRAYHLAAQGVLRGDLTAAFRDQTRPYMYPPTFAILISPLGLLPYRTALVLWTVLNAFLVIYIFRRMDRILGLPLPLVARVAGFFLIYRFLESDFTNGNANVIVLAVVLAGFDWARRHDSTTAGGILSVAILAKVTPVLILPWMVYRRRWKMLGGVFVGLLLLGLVMPGMVLGPQGAAHAWKTWKSVTIDHLDPTSGSYAEEPASGYEPGQSLRALVHRLLRDSDATAHDDTTVSIHLIDLPKQTADVVYLIAAAAMILLALYAAWRRARGAGLGWRPEEIAAACALMVLLAPISRKAHFVALWPAAVLGFEAWRLSGSRLLQRTGLTLWLLALALVVGTSPGFVGRDLSTRLLAHCPMSWAAAALLTLVSVRCFYPRGALESSAVLKEKSCDEK
jgi:hypothetical protein